MKKVVFSLITFVMFSVSVFGQIMTEKELKKYAIELYSDDWEKAAQNIASQATLDKNGALSFSQIIEAKGKTKDQLYVILNYWFSTTFKDAKNAIELNDKETGTIIAKIGIGRVAERFTYDKHLNAEPILKCDIKDGKMRVTYTVQSYLYRDNRPRRDEWFISDCYPFNSKSKHNKSMCCEALVQVVAYSNVIMHNIEESIKNGVIGNETEEW